MLFAKAATTEIAHQNNTKWNWLHLSIQITSLTLFFTVVAPKMSPIQDHSAIGAGLGTGLASTAHDQKKATASETNNDPATRSALHTPDLFMGIYGGAPFTYSSDVHTTRPNGTDFTLHDVDWYGKPFKSPIYYGARIAKWSERTPFGIMLDFTHSKAISNRQQEVRQSGIINNTPMPPKAKINETFRKLEFSHGHNMLTLNGLYRLPVNFGSVSPYIGLGGGISIPHSEIRFKGDLTRTYEYQYTGPAIQALFGLEFKLSTMSIFLEYKFTFADYQAPLTFRDGAWVTQDLWAQFQDWRAGKSGKGGSLSTKLASHQLIGGFGMRIAPNPVR